MSYLVGRLDRVLRRRLTDALGPHGLSLPEYTTLTVIRGTAGLSNAQLARRSLITPQAMSEVIARLEQRRLIRRRVDPTHARVRPAELTGAGDRLVRAADESVESIEQELLEGIAPSGQARLRDLLVAALRGAE